jgi:hypothetical protein
MVDLHDHPIFNDADEEIPLYDKDGFFIRRVDNKSYSGAPLPSILADLRKMHHLFSTIDDDSLDPDLAPVSVDGYSQAFTGFGNIQAKGVMPAFQARISHVNRAVSREGHHSAIQAPNMQGYSFLSHRTRPTAASHTAQIGQFTQLLSGTHGIRVTHQKKFERLRNKLDISGMPHEGLEHLINTSDPQLSNKFRLEVVYVVQMDQLKRTRTAGKYVSFFLSHIQYNNKFLYRRFFREVICPLVHQWDHPSVILPVRSCLAIIQPGVSIFSHFYLSNIYIVSFLDFSVHVQLGSLWYYVLPGQNP